MENFNTRTVFGLAPFLETVSLLLNQKFDSIQQLLELIETHEHCTYRGEYISKLNNSNKRDLIDLIEAKVDEKVEFILDIEIFDLCIVLARDGHDLHIDLSDVLDRETLHFNYMNLYNKYSTEKE